jgi:hypothetical protein
LVFGVGFIVTFVILAGMGLIPPVWGALTQVLAATVVVFNSARLVRFGEELHREAQTTPAAPPPRGKLEAVPTS